MRLSIRLNLHPVRCLVQDCPNRSDEGQFVGDLCAPCFAWLAYGEGTHSQAYRNARALGALMMLRTLRETNEQIGEVLAAFRSGGGAPTAPGPARRGRERRP